jgi:hypothetical protein
MAKRNSTRRAARKPKFIEVAGHQLTPGMQADYEICLEKRARTNAGDSADRILELGLDDLLTGYRPSRKIKRQLAVLSHLTTDIGIAIGTMKGYTFYAAEPASIRSAGCRLLKDLSLELYNLSATLTAIAGDVETESGLKVQDWLAQAERLRKMGNSQEFAHGNC